MAKKTQRPSVIIKTYEEAKSIVSGYAETRSYLISLIMNHVPNGQLVVDCSDFKNLKYYGRVIHGIAKKMLERKPNVSRDTEEAILASISNLKNCKDSTQRELLEERICIQLEGCKVPDNSSLVQRYERVRNN